MSGKVAALSAAIGLWLCSQALQAQDAPVQDPVPVADTAPVQAPVASSDKGLFGPVRVGPSVALGLPHPVTGGVDIVYADLFSVSVTGGRFNTTVNDIDLEIRNTEAAVRWYPFFGSFFVGAAYGTQGIVGKTTTDIEVTSAGQTLTIPTTIRIEIEGSYLTPQVGWFARWDSGLTLGFDVGFQMPSGVKSELQTSFRNVSTASEQAVRDSEEYKTNRQDAEDAAEKIGKQSIPYSSIFRIGWLF